jgi:UDP-N-acetylmuramoyl-L-alanyl-D-glutamate--2,6-diaminopimelate ligase
LNKILQDILSQVPTLKIVGNTNVSIDALCIDSRNCKTSSCFIAIKGTNTDGHQYIDKLQKEGIAAIVCEHLPAETVESVCYIVVENSAKTAGFLAANFYENPSKQLQLIGVTGTNGKTTVATLLYQLYTQLGFSCGLISTVENVIGTEIIPSTHTTPNPIELQALLHDMVKAGCAYAFMEVSSHAVHQHRIAGVHFVGALFTNISHDHLDYHQTFDAYISAKKMFFDDLPKTAFAISNIDDKRGMVMLQNTKAKSYTYGIKNLANYKGKILENGLSGLALDINGTEVHCRMIGEFNAYNILLVYSAATLLGTNKEQVLQVLSTLTGAEGRFECITSKHQNILGIVDYAHTPDALKNVLATIQKLRKGNEKVITVVGCGGDRDVTKRPIMAQVACEWSDRIILTSDNPRTEDPQAILKNMQEGVPVHLARKVMTIADRREAINTACQLANANDIVLIAGKGHEKYQDIQGIKHPFDDKQIVTQTLELLEK